MSYMREATTKSRYVMLALAGFAVLVGAVAGARSEGARPVVANIQGADAPAAPNQEAGEATDERTEAISATRPAPGDEISAKGIAQGSAAKTLLGAMDLTGAALENGRYQVELDDGRLALLTLDPALQREAEAVLARAKAPMAAVVVMHVDGRILALAGRREQRSAPDLATKVWAPAASIFKLVTAAALVDAGIRPGAKVCYHGGVRSIGAHNLDDHPKRDSQCNDLAYAVARSQNAIIAKLVHRHLDPARLRAVARAFGFGRAPAFALPAEPGRASIPDQPVDFARVAAGFWHTEISPLGGALIAGTVATGGLAVTPRIVDSVVRGATTTEITPAPARRAIAEHVARDVAHMMIGTTETGTAYKGFHDRKGRKFLPDIQVAGKTGTLTRSSPSYMQYSWFVGFAPAESPEIVISVLLGNPARWHLKAHTAARIILQKAL